MRATSIKLTFISTGCVIVNWLSAFEWWNPNGTSRGLYQFVSRLIEQILSIRKETPVRTQTVGGQHGWTGTAACLPKCSVLPRKFLLLSWNINHTCHQCGFPGNNRVCPLNRASMGAFSVLPPILSHRLDGSSNRHDWLTFRLVPFWDLQLSLAWPLPPNTPTDTPFTWIQPRSWKGATVGRRVGCRCYLSMSKPL